MKNGIQQFGMLTLQIIVGICLIGLIFFIVGFADTSNDNSIRNIGQNIGNQVLLVCDYCNRSYQVVDIEDDECPYCGGTVRKVSADRMNVTSKSINYREKLPKMKISELSCTTGDTLNVRELFDTLECEGCDKELTITDLNDGKCSVCAEKISMDYAVDYQGADISDTVKMYGVGVLEGNTKFKVDRPGIYQVTFIATDVNYDLIVKQKVKISVSEETEGRG